MTPQSGMDGMISGRPMFDHLGFGVTHLGQSKAYFLQALEPLKATVVMEGPYGRSRFLQWPRPRSTP
ncbi:MAG TPA: hypothetical protein VLE94_12000 [Burkholderiaceae bacterium]|nr:hypothetical protein [Burkholderiaceae bacterium]